MTEWRVHDNGDFNVFSVFSDDFFKRKAEGAARFPHIGKLTKNYSGGAIKNTESFQMKKHAVDVAEFLVAVFEKKDGVLVKFTRQGLRQILKNAEIAAE